MVAYRKLVSLTVVAPFYNEADGALHFYEELTSQLEEMQLSYNLIFVDDGSLDETLAILNQIADRDERITVLSLARNFGHQAALTAGLDFADAEATVVMDSDLQHPPKIIPEMVREYEKGAEVVYAVREDPKGVGLFKKLFSGFHYFLLKHFSNITVIAGAADFRLMSKVCVRKLRSMRETHRYLRGMIPWLGYPHTIVRYDQPERFSGVPGYSWKKSLQMAHHALFSFSRVPLDLVTWLGVGLTILGVVYLVYILAVSFMGITVPGWSSVMVAVMVIGGVQLISVGIIAQYIGMIFEQVKQRPLYVLKQKRIGAGPIKENDETQNY